MPEISRFAGFAPPSVFNLPAPSEISTLNKISFVQNTIDEFLPPLLSNRIEHGDKDIVTVIAQCIKIFFDK